MNSQRLSPRPKRFNIVPSVLVGGALGIFGAIWLACFAFAVLSIPAYLCHIIHRLHTHEWLVLVAGALAFPIGMIDGWGIWLHWWR